MIYRVIGPAIGSKRCDCEASFCHPDANCRNEAEHIVEAFGERQRVCPSCMRKAQARYARTGNDLSGQVRVKRSSAWERGGRKRRGEASQSAAWTQARKNDTKRSRRLAKREIESQRSRSR